MGAWDKRRRRKMRHMRTIVVDGTIWRWCVVHDDRPYSEYTPAMPETTIYLRGPDGALQRHRAADVTVEDAITPSVIAGFIQASRLER